MDTEAAAEEPEEEPARPADAEEALLEDDEPPPDSIPRPPPLADADARSELELRGIETTAPARRFLPNPRFDTSAFEILDP